ncbi:acriflavin resistance protein [Candidatus Tenderia electrophaga]|jgi:multidrug efflux pump|uniref:Acriflavin resistance protein n=1 Tax=Candidatus Tenderia electrophaga TaxID=1748243 RepID=A0A0S2TCU5_9GAMM|nr:acriflavin resistance protein [Candidatus Tenderia electrophaga]
MKLIESVLGHSRTVIAALVLLFIAGSYSYISIPKEAEPDVDIPFIIVSVTLEGVSPEDAERLMIRPLEEALRSIDGLKQMTASIFEGGGNVILEFSAGFDADDAVQDVREAVDRARPELPEATDEPEVTEINTSLFPVLITTLSGDVPERTLVRLARQLRDEIEGIPAVLDVAISGDREEVVEVIIDPLLVESYGLQGSEVAALLSRSNRLVAAGDLETESGRFAVKVPGLFESVEDILNMPVKVSGDAVVRFRDIADVRRTFKDPNGFARVNGYPAVALEISKRTGENVIDTVAQVRQVVDEMSANWPEAVRIDYSQDQSEFIQMMLHDLENHVVTAVVLVMVVIVGVLGFRTAFLVGVAVPGSFLCAILVLHLFGMTVNMVVLFALILSVGMLVDGAIIVTEYADRKMAEGLDRRAAYIAASKRMALPIISATVTTLMAFLPMLFWPGIVGEFMKYFPITLVATMTASLVMALIFIPTLGAYMGRRGANGRGELKRLAVAEQGDLSQIDGFGGWYLKVLRSALRHPGQVLLVTAALLVGIWHSYAMYGKGLEFFPDVETDFAAILVHARGNLSIYQKDALMREVEHRVLQLSDEFDSVYTRTGSAGGLGWEVSEDVIGQISLQLADWAERRQASEILADIRERTQDLAGIRVEARRQEAGPPVGKPVQVQLAARVPELLPVAVEKLRRFMTQLEGLEDVEDDRPLPGIEWKLAVDRSQAAKFGLDVTAVGDAIRLVSNGLVVGTYRPDDSDDELDIVVRYPHHHRTVNELDDIRVATGAGTVPISNFVQRSAQRNVGTINRADGRRVMAVRADVAPGVLADDKIREIRAWLQQGADLPAGVSWTFKGQEEEQKAAQQFLVQAFFVAIFLMAIVLVTQFNSFFSAFLVLSAIIVSSIGAVAGLLLTGQAFGIVVTGVGMIALAGVVVNDNIVLIDTYDQLKQNGAERTDAILRTGVLRLRPVILTTVTTVLGLLPMLLRLNIDLINRDVAYAAPITDWWVSLATVVVFGLMFATVLTLLITPCALKLQADFHAWRQARRHGAAAER